MTTHELSIEYDSTTQNIRGTNGGHILFDQRLANSTRGDLEAFVDSVSVQHPGLPRDELMSCLSSQVPLWPDTLDENALHGPAGELVRLIEPHTEADPVALLVQTLVYFGNVIGRHSYFTADGARHCLNLFAVLVGDTSKGRKGTSRAHIEKVFNRFDRDWVSRRIMSGLSSGEGLIWTVRDPIHKVEQVRDNGRVTDDVQEVLVDHGESDKRLLVIEGEFASVLKVMSRQGNTLSALIRQAWDTGKIRTMTKNNPAKSTGAHVSIVGHITPQELRRLLTSTESGNGFANRFLWICVRRSKYLPLGGQIDSVDFSQIDRILAKAIEFGLKPRELRFDPEAEDV